MITRNGISKKAAAVFSAICMASVSVLGGCGGTAQATAAAASTTAIQTTVQTTETTAAAATVAAEAKTASESVKESSSAKKTVTITDMAGRTVTYPENPQKVFSSSPASEAWLCALIPGKMIGWANKMSKEQLSYYPKEVADIPLVGGWYGYTEGNTEGIITMAPDVVITASNLTSDENTKKAIQDADELSKKLGTPVIVVSYDLKDVPDVMRDLGKWLGEEARGKELGDYLQAELDKAAESVAKVPADKIVSYYYAEDASGLMTESADSFHSAVFQFCNMKCANDVKMSSFMGREQVSLEQVINWNPQYIFAFDPNALNTIRTGAGWSGIQAVKDNHVYYCVSNPQNWFDRSPNPLRVLGCLYVASTCYPDYVSFKLDTEITEFFQKMYQVSLTTDQVHALYQK